MSAKETKQIVNDDLHIVFYSLTIRVSAKKDDKVSLNELESVASHSLAVSTIEMDELEACDSFANTLWTSSRDNGESESVAEDG